MENNRLNLLRMEEKIYLQFKMHVVDLFIGKQEDKQMTYSQNKYYPTDGQIDKAEAQFYLDRMQDADLVREALADMSDKELIELAEANALQAHQVKERVIRRYLKSFVARDIDRYIAEYHENVEADIIERNRLD